MAVAKIVSFDLDGTLTHISFVNNVWLEGLPGLYATHKDLNLEEAKSFVLSEYRKVDKKQLEWYDLEYWTKRFGLEISTTEFLIHFQHSIKMHSEVPKVLKALQNKGYRLVVLTNARREFADLELETLKLKDHFEQVFSATSDFGLTKYNVNLYRKVCRICEVTPNEMIHVGDEKVLDYEVPKKIGIIAFFLDREHEYSSESIIHSLEDLNNIL